MVDLLDGKVAIFVLQEANAKTVELFDDRVAALCIFIDRLLVDDPVIGNGDLLGVLLGRRVARNDRVVEAVHPHGNRARPLDIGLLQQNDISLGIFQLGLERGHRSGGTASDHQYVAGDLGEAVNNVVHRYRSFPGQIGASSFRRT